MGTTSFSHGRVWATALIGLIMWTGYTRATESYDVVIYGGTPGGIAAAIAAAREKAAAVVIEPTQHIGGMVAGGLSRTDFGNPTVIGGIARDFFNALMLYTTTQQRPRIAPNSGSVNRM